jgi:hypothetical protein
MLTPGDYIGIFIAAGLTLMMFSFIYKDNAFFKFGEHLYLGISVGYYINIMYWNVVYPDVIRETSVNNNYWVLIPAVLGILILLRMIPKLGWLSRMSFAFYIGGFAGLAIPNVIHGVLLPQLNDTLRPFEGGWLLALLTIVIMLVFFGLLAYAVHAANLWAGIGSLVVLIGALALLGNGILPAGTAQQMVVLVGVFTVLIFFFFSLEHKGTVGGVSRIGLFFIMVSFGASFGYTVMARISLLIGRFQFLIEDFFKGAILGQ